MPTTGTLATLNGSETLLNKAISSTAAVTGALQLPAGDNLERPSGVDGMIRYNNESGTFEGYKGAAWSGIGGGGGCTVFTIVAANSFVIGDVVYYDGTSYVKAIASAANTAEVIGMISAASPTQFDITMVGEVTKTAWGLTPGEAYFLSATTAGLIVTTEPTTIGQVSVPIGVASSATTMYVAPKRGAVVGGTNARAQVSLTSGATTNVQNVGTMDAGELTGWVFISSAAPVRFYVSAKFAKSGAGGDYNLSYQTTGDTPPAGFLVDITTTGMIRVTLPASSGSTSVINYALNAPAIGASFPLTVNADTILSGTVDDERLPDPTTYTDAKATKMGLKQYLHGGNYSGGLALTVSSTAAGFSVIRGVFIPYQMQDGTWRCKINASFTFNSVSNITITISNLFLKNIANFNQALTAVNRSAPLGAFAVGISPGANQIYINSNGNVAVTNFELFGDIELDSKPTWAY
jgi:hypothetical protein